MVIRHNKKRTNARPFARHFGDDPLNRRPIGRRNVVDRHDECVLPCACRCDDRKKLRGHNRRHSLNFRRRAQEEQEKIKQVDCSVPCPPMGRTRPVASSMAGDGGGAAYSIASSDGAPKPFGSSAGRSTVHATVTALPFSRLREILWSRAAW